MLKICLVNKTKIYLFNNLSNKWTRFMYSIIYQMNKIIAYLVIKLSNEENKGSLNLKISRRNRYKPICSILH